MPSATIRKAIIPAAGLGTRFLPATKASPKEMLPLVDKPLIQYAVEEAVASGIEDIIIVTGRGKRDRGPFRPLVRTRREPEGKREGSAPERHPANLRTRELLLRPTVPGARARARRVMRPAPHGKRTLCRHFGR